MGQALRRAAEQRDIAEGAVADTPTVSPGASPVHDLQDLLTRRLAEDAVAVPSAISPQGRMAIVFWLAIAAWIVVALAGYAVFAAL